MEVNMHLPSGASSSFVIRCVMRLSIEAVKQFLKHFVSLKDRCANYGLKHFYLIRSNL